MNSKVTTNSQPAANEPKKIKESKTIKAKTNQTTRTGTESQKWRSHGELSVGRGMGEKGGKVQGKRSINCRYKMNSGRLRMV